MKILKLFLIFIVFVGGIFLLSQWKDIFGTGITEPPTNTLAINAECENIRKAWAKEKNFNADLFNRQVADKKQKHKLGRFESEGDYATAINTLRESATNRLDTAIFRQFHNADCNDDLVRLNYAGLDIILAEFATMDRDPRVERIRQTKKVYDQISTFVKSPHTIVARYNAADNSWTSFETLSRNIFNTAQNFRNNSIYKEHLSDITRFKDGLSDSHIRTVVNGQENGFYASLCRQIIDHFNKASLTEANLARYNNAYDKYSRETSRYAKDLATELRAFRKRYEAEMEKNK